jgi:hypothetical protein
MTLKPCPNPECNNPKIVIEPFFSQYSHATCRECKMHGPHADTRDEASAKWNALPRVNPPRHESPYQWEAGRPPRIGDWTTIQPGGWNVTLWEYGKGGMVFGTVVEIIEDVANGTTHVRLA